MQNRQKANIINVNINPAKFARLIQAEAHKIALDKIDIDAAHELRRAIIEIVDQLSLGKNEKNVYVISESAKEIMDQEYDKLTRILKDKRRGVPEIITPLGDFKKFISSALDKKMFVYASKNDELSKISEQFSTSRESLLKSLEKENSHGLKLSNLRALSYSIENISKKIFDNKNTVNIASMQMSLKELENELKVRRRQWGDERENTESDILDELNEGKERDEEATTQLKLLNEMVVNANQFISVLKNMEQKGMVHIIDANNLHFERLHYPVRPIDLPALNSPKGEPTVNVKNNSFPVHRENISPTSPFSPESPLSPLSRAIDKRNHKVKKEVNAYCAGINKTIENYQNGYFKETLKTHIMELLNSLKKNGPRLADDTRQERMDQIDCYINLHGVVELLLPHLADSALMKPLEKIINETYSDLNCNRGNEALVRLYKEILKVHTLTNDKSSSSLFKRKLDPDIKKKSQLISVEPLKDSATLERALQRIIGNYSQLYERYNEEISQPTPKRPK